MDRSFLAAEFKRVGVRPLQFNRGLCTMVRFQEDNGGRRQGSRLEDAAKAMGVPGRKGETRDAEEDAVIAMLVAGGYYCIDNGIGRPGQSRGWLRVVLWVAAIGAGGGGGGGGGALTRAAAVPSGPGRTRDWKRADRAGAGPHSGR